MLLEKYSKEEILKILDEKGYIFPQFELSKNDNQIVSLGKGGSAFVYEMINKKRPQLKYALKVIGFENNAITPKEFYDTAYLQHYLGQQSRFITRLLDIREILIRDNDNFEVRDISKDMQVEEDGLYLQFILMEKLTPIISKKLHSDIPCIDERLNQQEEVLNLAYSISEALKIAHKNNILHRDIKLENIFWDENEELYKLGDFGVAKFTDNGNAQTIVYTDGYGAPEVERKTNDFYGKTADIYSYGITLYLLLNNMKFPGSAGYYAKPDIQYNPNNVFPAPDNANEVTAMVLRKMCSYYSEDRYQDIQQAYLDFKKSFEFDTLQNVEEQSDEETEIYQGEETVYQDNTTVLNQKDEEVSRELTRSEKIEKERDNEFTYKFTSCFYALAIIFLLVLLFKGMITDNSITTNWLMMIMPVLMLVESFCQKEKVFHIELGIFTILMICYSAFINGITIIHIILLLFVMSGYSLLTFSGAIASGIWNVLTLTKTFMFLDFVVRYDLCWIVLTCLYVLLSKYYYNRYLFGKVTKIREVIEMFIFIYCPLLLVFVGICLSIGQWLNLWQIPEFISRIHPILTGVVSTWFIYGYFEKNDYFCEEDEIEDSE